MALVPGAGAVGDFCYVYELPAGGVAAEVLFRCGRCRGSRRRDGARRSLGAPKGLRILAFRTNKGKVRKGR